MVGPVRVIEERPVVSQEVSTTAVDIAMWVTDKERNEFHFLVNKLTPLTRHTINLAYQEAAEEEEVSLLSKLSRTQISSHLTEDMAEELLGLAVVYQSLKFPLMLSSHMLSSRGPLVVQSISTLKCTHHTFHNNCHLTRISGLVIWKTKKQRKHQRHHRFLLTIMKMKKLKLLSSQRT